ncbi:unnamed protein product [Tetraodon nigroviridis]|uniref:(spotted green pufferfish) hypothetical protein n=1 Tax=Tetraodon nigroviridis TaxID=99883 RepID=Q4RWK4_TETNG|nr:unnamed protein product [Tetraodon nigroviridis]
MSLHGKRKEIYKYEAPWTVYAMNWSVRPDKRFRLALGSFVEEYNNKVQLVGLEEESSEFVCRNTFDHPYPTTKIMWIPDTKGIYPDLLATSGDYLRIWRVRKARIDTTCTIWGLETGQVLGRVNLVSGHVKTQLIAHDKEVYDIAFSRAGGGRDMFASVGADGSVRMFDLRHLEHSTIIYEDPQHHPLLRLCWNKQDPNYLATMAMDGMEVRLPTFPNTHAGGRFPSLTWNVLCASGGHPGRACAVHSGGAAQQPPRLRQRHRLGASFLVSHLHSSRRPPGSDLGHPADAPGHRGPHPGLHGRRGDQQRAVGLHAARLDRHLLQQLPGDPPCIKTHSDTIFHPLLSSRG